MQNFNLLFESLSAQEKSDYLLEILQKKPKQKQAFVERFKERLEKIRLNNYVSENIEEVLNEIKEIADDLKEELDTLDFEETDWGRWCEPGHYVPEWEVAREVAEEEAMELFEPWLFELKVALKAENLFDIAKKYLIIFDGTKRSKINDPYNNLSDSPEDFFIDCANDLIKKKSTELNNREFLSPDYLNTFDLVFRFNRINYLDDVELLKGLSHLLIPLIKDKEIAAFVWQKKEERQTNLSIVPVLLNHIVTTMGDEKLWLKNMEACFLNDRDTSIKLMDYYYKNDLSKFEDNAPKLYAKFRYTGEYLIDKIKSGTSFYIRLLKDITLQKGTLEYYVKLKEFLDQEQQTEFVNSIESHNFKALLLAEEKRFDELIQLIKKQCIINTNDFTSLNFEKSIELISKTHPNESWELINKKIKQKMKGERSRNAYYSIAILLKKAAGLKGKNTEANILIKELYNHKPNLPALKDEFRKAGIV